MAANGAGELAKDPSERVRRNVTGVKPDYRLPAAGRKGAAPKPPLKFNEVGEAFWQTLWHTPQAIRFTKGDLYPLARYTKLAEEWVLLEGYVPENGGPSATELRLRIDKSMKDFEDRFGLSPKAMSALHWYMELSVDEIPKGRQAKATVADMRQRLLGISA